MNTNNTNYDLLMRANLLRVWSERNVEKRLAAIRELYLEDAVLNEPEVSVKGHQAISDAVSALLESLPPNFTFLPLGPAQGHHQIGRLAWSCGPAGGPAAVTGMDIIHFQGQQIHSIFVFLDSKEGQS